MWKYPWKYKEAIWIAIFLTLVGILLQLSLPPVPLELLKFPLNIYSGIGYLIGLFVLFLWGKRNKYIYWFSCAQAAIISLSSLLILIVVMGLTKQLSLAHTQSLPWWNFGFSQMTRSWVFAVHFFYFLTILGLVSLRRLAVFHKRDLPFVLNHWGLFIALFAGILGNGDVQKLRLQALLNKPTSQAFDAKGQLHQLPFSMQLQSFSIVAYPPKLCVVDNKTKQMLPLKRPENLVVSDSITKGKLFDWMLTPTQFLPFAVPLLGTDTSQYVATKRKGAPSAIYLIAEKGGQTKAGWVSSGNAWFPYKLLQLDEHCSIAMLPLEPKQFISKLQFTTQDQQKIKATIEVNKTFSIEGWKIYQVGYNEQMGRWSTSSILELVKDPWLPFVYWGIGMMLAGALCLFLFAKHPSKHTEK